MCERCCKGLDRDAATVARAVGLLDQGRASVAEAMAVLLGGSGQVQANAPGYITMLGGIHAFAGLAVADLEKIAQGFRDLADSMRGTGHGTG